MPIILSNIEVLKDLVAKDPMLCEALQRATSSEEFTTTLITAAKTNNVRIDETALGRDLERVFDQYAESQELSDERLTGVVGGYDDGGSKAIAIGISIVLRALGVIPIVGASERRAG